MEQRRQVGGTNPGRGGSPTAFLGGPIQHLLDQSNSDRVVASHREIASALRSEAWEVLSAHEAEEYGKTSREFSPVDVTDRDLRWTKECDAYIAVLPVDSSGVPYRTDGTHIEIGWASALSKPVILILKREPSVPYSHLVLGLIATGQAEMVALDRWREELPPMLHNVSKRARLSGLTQDRTADER